VQKRKCDDVAGGRKLDRGPVLVAAEEPVGLVGAPLEVLGEKLADQWIAKVDAVSPVPASSQSKMAMLWSPR